MYDQNRALRIIYWVAVGILALLFLYLLSKILPLYKEAVTVFFHILTPFIIAAVIAYLLHPLIELLHKYNFPRWLAIIGIYILFFGGVTYLIYKLYPIFIHQLKDLNHNLPYFMEQYRDAIYSMYESTSYLPETVHDKMDTMFSRIEQFIDNLLTSIASKLTKIMDIIVIIAVIPVLVFYMLKDFSLIKRALWKLAPSKYRQSAGRLVHDIDKSLGAYIRGQLLVCLFVSITTYGVFWFIGMKYPLLLALLMGATNLIPYFGPYLGAVPAVVIAFTISYKMVLYVIIGVFIVQIIEGNLLSPFIVGKSVNIHPILIIFALLVGGEFGGIIGMILAVPLLSVLKVILIHIWSFRLDD
ncbi:AI-2E family transporter [Sediminibacillus massiliensis]|uniref:AI-2E family transporter n=1 Tax=Sediminibacillus massiliensis TaxID=1926277 RepID=UPI0009882E0F|nr:AI-2E family transporter [Sediminibacillus massiliensis]